MATLINNLNEVLESFTVAVLDQWGVLHNGTRPYPSAAQAMKSLRKHGKDIIVLSNSGKRSDINAQRIRTMGLPIETVSKVITSGEALWEDLRDARIQIKGKTPERIFPISGDPRDPLDWLGENGELEIAAGIDEHVDAIMLMGLKDGTRADAYDHVFESARRFDTTLICSNPDKTSVRDGGMVISPGALADRYATMGGTVIWYGKPHTPMFNAVSRCYPELPANRFLMIGDSMEHDIAGAQKAGFLTAFIRGGIHHNDFSTALTEDISQEIDNLSVTHEIETPDYSLEILA